MKLAAVGDNCMDVYDKTGEMFPGGNPVNVAVYYVRLGGEASYTGVVGNDSYGKVMQEAVGKKGVDVSHLHTREGQTAVTHVEIVNGDRVLGEYEEGVLSDFKLSSEDIDFLCSHDLIVSGLWGKVENDLKEIKKRGKKVAFDAATRPEDPAALTAIPDTDYLFFASDDGDTPLLREKMKKLYAEGPEIVTVTLGDKGSIAYDGAEFYTFGIVTCSVVDTMGAGDSYIAGFLKGIMEKKSIQECMKMGASNSSITLEYNGAW